MRVRSTLLLPALIALLASVAFGDRPSQGANEECSSPEDVAKKLRSRGDDLMMAKKYKEASAVFSEAIEEEPLNEKNFLKRFKAHEKSQNTQAALADLDAALELNPESTTALAFRARTLMSLGRCSEAEQDYLKVKKLKPTHGDAKKMLPKAQECGHDIQEAERLSKQRRFDSAEKKLSEVVDSIGKAPHVMMLRAKARFDQEKFFEAIADCGDVLKKSPEDQGALLLRGLGYYRVADFEMAKRHFREGLKKDPEHQEMREALKRVQKLEKLMKSGDKAMQDQQDLESAETSYNQALQVDPKNKEVIKSVRLKLCKIHTGMKKVPEARRSCEEAIKLDGSQMEAYILIANLLSKVAEESADFEEAVRAWRRAADVDRNNREVRDGLHKAEVALKQSKQKNYYKILGVRRDADSGTIKKAYRTLAKQVHPDRHADKSEEEKETMKEKFALVAEAYEVSCKKEVHSSRKLAHSSQNFSIQVLSDPELRGKYDRGEEVFENQGNDRPRGPFPFQFRRRY